MVPSKGKSQGNKSEERGRNKKCMGSLNRFLCQEHSTIENNGK